MHRKRYLVCSNYIDTSSRLRMVFSVHVLQSINDFLMKNGKIKLGNVVFVRRYIKMSCVLYKRIETHHHQNHIFFSIGHASHIFFFFLMDIGWDCAAQRIYICVRCVGSVLVYVEKKTTTPRQEYWSAGASRPKQQTNHKNRYRCHQIIQI